MRAIATIACALLLLTAGCLGVLNPQETETPTDTATDAPTQTQTATSTPTETDRMTDTETSSPTATEVTEQPTETSSNPWGTETVKVRFHDSTDSDRDFLPGVKSAIDYWNGRTAKYSDYNVTFEHQSDLTASEADLNIIATDPIEYCAGPVDKNTTTLGCYRHEHRVEIFDNQTNHQFRNTVIHEIGHTLELRHHDEPLWAMATASETYISSDTDARNRTNPYRVNDTLKVAIGDSVQNTHRYENDLEQAVDYYNRMNDVPADLDLVAVDESHDAHIVFEGPDEVDYEFDGPSSVSYTYGIDFDSDRDFEFWELYTVYVNELDQQQSEKLFGYWIGLGMGIDEGELPGRYQP